MHYMPVFTGIKNCQKSPLKGVECKIYYASNMFKLPLGRQLSFPIYFFDAYSYSFLL